MAVISIPKGFRIENSLIEYVIVQGAHRTEYVDAQHPEVVVVNGETSDYRVTESTDTVHIELAGVVNKAPGGSSERVQLRDVKGGVNFSDLSSVRAQVPSVLLKLPKSSKIAVLPL